MKNLLIAIGFLAVICFGSACVNKTAETVEEQTVVEQTDSVDTCACVDSCECVDTCVCDTVL